MEYVALQWSGDLLVACKKNSVSMVYFHPVDKMNAHWYKTDPMMLTIGSIPFLGDLYRKFTAITAVSIFKEFQEGYYD